MSRESSALSLWHRLGCCLTGHDYSISSDHTRMFVRCNNCGHTSPGLEIDRDLFRAGPDDRRASAAGSRAGAGHSNFAIR